VIEEGVTGFIVPDVDGAVRAVKRVGEIDRNKCRAHFEQFFDAERMAHDYLNIYQRLILGESPSISVSDGVLSCAKMASHNSTT
jgi:glycosyltransferase involved in cell wall biosynthesis